VQRGNPRLVATSSFYNVWRSKNGGGGRYGGVEREAHDWRGGRTRWSRTGGSAGVALPQSRQKPVVVWTDRDAGEEGGLPVGPTA
jgi:hypothetical protein